MKPKPLLFNLVLALCLAFPAHAANDKKGYGKTPAEEFAALDKNGDGVVTLAEYVEAMKDKLGEDGAKKHFGELDKNHDGKLTKTEFGVPDTEKKQGRKKKNPA